ncbi:MAG: hypothetical protein JXA30_00325 [Deltaproteobacteria bacterium]|nr:hypothetical protein [Deltaproteobacteria bacterium]
MDKNTPLLDKKAAVQKLLCKGNVFLHLDPRKSGVVVPDLLRNQLQLVLQIGYDLPIRIPDLVVDDTGVSATLSFHRSPFTCRVPWDSLFALVGDDGRGMVWLGDMPAEIVAEIESEAQRKELKEIADALRAKDLALKNGKNGKNGVNDSGGARFASSSGKTRNQLSETTERSTRSAESSRIQINASTKSGSPGAGTKNHSDKRRRSRGNAVKKPIELPPYLRVVK